VALHCTHAGLVYTVTVICGTAPLRTDWQLVWYCISLRFSGPRALKIPGVRAVFRWV
jgi:hypothetical protein